MNDRGHKERRKNGWKKEWHIISIEKNNSEDIDIPDDPGAEIVSIRLVRTFIRSFCESLIKIWLQEPCQESSYSLSLFLESWRTWIPDDPGDGVRLEETSIRSKMDFSFIQLINRDLIDLESSLTILLSSFFKLYWISEHALKKETFAGLSPPSRTISTHIQHIISWIMWLYISEKI